MSAARERVVRAALNRSINLIDYNIYNNVHKKYEFRRQTIQEDESLTEDEKAEAMKIINRTYDLNKLIFNEGTKRICENCSQECLATLFCEYCVRNYLNENFLNWTSGNDDIDNLIQECQMKTPFPNGVIEWIPYRNLQNIEYLTKGGCSEIYTADWIDGRYIEWDSNKQQLIRKGIQRVILKKLESVGRADRSWFEEVCSN